MADAPASSMIFAISSALFSSHPLLIFAVTGIGTVSTTVFIISSTLLGFLSNALPAPDLTATFVTGHPILMSMISGDIFS